MKFPRFNAAGIRLAMMAIALPLHAHSALTAQEVADKAERHSSKTIAAQAGIEAAQAQRELAAAWPNPELGFSFDDTGTEDESRSLQLTQRIELGGKASRRVRAATAHYRTAEATLQQTVIDVRIDAAKAFHELALAELRLREARASGDIAAQFSQALARKLAAGKVPPIDATKARLAELTAATELKNAERQHRLAQRRLEQLIGEPLPEEGHALPALPPAPPSSAEARQQLMLSPQTRLSQLRVESSEAEVGLQDGQRWPDLQLSAGVKETVASGERGGLFGIAIEIPLFNWNNSGVSAAKAKLRQAQAEQQSQLRERDLLVQSLHAELIDLVERIHLYQSDIIPAAEAAVSAARTGYDYGRHAFIDVLDAQRSLLAARSERTDLWQQYLDRLAQFERELGIGVISQ
ncbi:TolC family protein [Chitiniphilus purpureus]|uniref:TolC family protein n=1 Tax=Chitiniphilus purpureus TaxID=2981137 RepID=A0ABY6DKU3_9NEIS|nr:TolC family protein [Chitiniphilus sp. CD1]UXY14081.1 TolC family protein [Chitiniphilus sp. CD1]